MPVKKLWAIRMDESYEVQGESVRLAFKKGDTIDDLKREAGERFSTLRNSVDHDKILIKRIKEPIRPSICTRSSNQRPLEASEEQGGNSTPSQSIDELVSRLKSGDDSCIEALHSMEDVMNCFKNIIDKMIYVIVMHPVLEGKKRKRGLSSSDVRSEADNARFGHLKKIVATRSPPSETQRVHGTTLRENTLTGRPHGHCAFPVSLYNKSLGMLQHMLDASKEAKPLSDEATYYVSASREFQCNALKSQESERERWDALKRYFGKAFGYDNIKDQFRIPRSESEGSFARVDACVITNLNFGGATYSIPRVIFEVKKEKGNGDPVAQCTKAYAEVLFRLKSDKELINSSYFPVIFICLDGHELEICTAVFLEYIVVDSILKLSLLDSVHQETLINQLARIATALSACSAELQRELESPPLQSGNPGALGDRQNYFPQPSLLDRTNNDFRDLRFESHYAYPPGDDILRLRSLFLAKMKNASGEDVTVVVKFAVRYGEDAHKALASEGFAPQLHGCQPVLGGLQMVVMEYLDSFERLDEAKGTKQEVFQKLERAVTKLRERGFVHGDLRAPNVMVNSDGQVKIVDFDWAARDREGRYPSTINKSALTREWSKDVDVGEVMRTEHDQYALQEILKPKYFK